MVELYQLHTFLTVPCACEFITNGGSIWTAITYPPDQLIGGAKLFRDTGTVQGSGLGLPLYVVEASDLHSVHPENLMAKYANDMYLLIGASKRDAMVDELRSVAKW